MKNHSLILVASLLSIMAGCSTGTVKPSHFLITETDLTIDIKEDSLSAFVYQKMPKTLTGQYVCNNYIHPLYNLVGESLTAEFPPDHPYHRGVFWAWHQLYAGNVRLGDGWMNDSIAQDVVKADVKNLSDRVQLNLDVQWRSLVYGNGKPFMNEKTTITLHRLDSMIRKIDFEITLRALVPGLQMGGSADKKGYGGFCIRFDQPDSLIFTSDSGSVNPQELQLKAGPWMDFSGRFGLIPIVSGVTILSHPGNPDYPEKWILRQKASMQNVVFPGSGRINVPMDKPIVLHYRLIIHNGDAYSINLPRLLKEYSTMYEK